jgi:SIR2-like protein
MRMSGVEIPSSLIEAHASGKLVIFVGAGASIPPPSGLPGFTSLVKTIRKESNLKAVIGKIKGRALDEVLSEISDHGVKVHERVAELTNKPGSMPSSVHEAVIKLASATTPRIVTTNYDRHLSTLIDPGVPEYLAPALPVGDDFWGIVYLHGRLDQEPSKLIVTADDFGKAYLTDVWAARFLDRMFASRPVLFVGYSHTDTIMKYLARGLGGRSEKRYALTNDANSALWRQLGITPLKCSYEDLPVVLDDWAAKASYGLLGHREHVKALVENQDPSPTPEAMSYLESIVSGKDTVKFFTRYARGKSWLRWIAGRPEFGSLFYPLPQVDSAVTSELASWFAENYLTDDDMSDIALRIVADAGGQPPT